MSDTIQFACTSCGKKLKVQQSMARKKGMCPGCGSVLSIPFVQIEEDEVILNQISAPSNTKYCHHCGKTISAIAEICPQCGVRQPAFLSTGGKAADSSPNKVVACLFAIFLGLLGAHKFYLGQTTWGVMYITMNILLFWTVVVPTIFFVICMIEGLSYLTYSDTDFSRKYGG